MSKWEQIHLKWLSHVDRPRVFLLKLFDVFPRQVLFNIMEILYALEATCACVDVKFTTDLAQQDILQSLDTEEVRSSDKL